MIKFFRLGAAEDVMSQGFEKWSKSDTFMNAVVKRIVSNPLFILPMAGFIKQHVRSYIDECSLKRLYAGTGKVGKTEVPLPPSMSSSDAAQESGSTLKRKTPNIERVRNKYSPCEGPDHQKC